MLDSDIILDLPGPVTIAAFGHCTLTANGGLCTFSGGTGKFARFRATVDVSTGRARTMAGTGRTASVRAIEPRSDATGGTAPRGSPHTTIVVTGEGIAREPLSHPYRRRRRGSRGTGREYDVTPDGRFLINTELDTAAAPMTLLQNWHPEAKK